MPHYELDKTIHNVLAPGCRRRHTRVKTWIRVPGVVRGPVNEVGRRRWPGAVPKVDRYDHSVLIDRRWASLPTSTGWPARTA